MFSKNEVKSCFIAATFGEREQGIAKCAWAWTMKHLKQSKVCLPNSANKVCHSRKALRPWPLASTLSSSLPTSRSSAVLEQGTSWWVVAWSPFSWPWMKCGRGLGDSFAWSSFSWPCTTEKGPGRLSQCWQGAWRRGGGENSKYSRRDKQVLLLRVRGSSSVDPSKQRWQSFWDGHLGPCLEWASARKWMVCLIGFDFSQHRSLDVINHLGNFHLSGLVWSTPDWLCWAVMRPLEV